MYKVLIVDDELLVRTHLRTMIDWELHDFVICAEASNGREALDVMNKAYPDIVISDIRMPEMNGLELSRELHENYPDIRIVMLSNYDDFEYVKGTLQYGAVDYLLKHRLNEDVLLETLARMKSVIAKLLQANGNAVPKAPFHNTQALKQKFVVQLLTRFFKDEAEIGMHLKAQQLQLELTKLVPIVLEVDDFRDVMAKRGLKEETLLQFAIINILEEILNDNENGVVGYISNGRFAILLSFASIRSSATINQTIQSVIARIDQCLKQYVKVTASFSIGHFSDRMIHVPDHYEEACKALAEKFYLGKNCRIYPTANFTNVNEKITGLELATEKELMANIKLGDAAKVTLILGKIFDFIQKERLSLVASQMIFNELLGMVNRICKENLLNLEKVYALLEPPYEIMSKLVTLYEIRSWVSGIFGRLLQTLHNNPNKNVSEHIKKVCIYLQQHMHDNISLTQVADEIGLTPSYLSTVFKEEMGIGFSDYFMDLRLEKAKALMQEGRMDLKEIVSVCGFNNYTYFFKAFKRRTNETPTEYMNRNKV